MHLAFYGCTNARRIGRGKTTGLSIAKKRRKGATGKLHVIIPADKIVAVGPRTDSFVVDGTSTKHTKEVILDTIKRLH